MTDFTARVNPDGAHPFLEKLLEGPWFQRRFTKREFLFAMERTLSERQYTLLEMRLLGRNGKGVTYSDMARVYGMSTGRVGQICTQALRRVRYYLRGERVRNT